MFYAWSESWLFVILRRYKSCFLDIYILLASVYSSIIFEWVFFISYERISFINWFSDVLKGNTMGHWRKEMTEITLFEGNEGKWEGNNSFWRLSALRKKYPNLKFYWSVFSSIRTVNLRIQPKCRKCEPGDLRIFSEYFPTWQC